MNHDIEKALDNLEKRSQDIQHYMNIMSKVKTAVSYTHLPERVEIRVFHSLPQSLHFHQALRLAKTVT